MKILTMKNYALFLASSKRLIKLNKKLVEYLQWDITNLAEKIKNKELSPVEITMTLLDEINNHNPTINSYISVFSESAMTQAKKLETELLNDVYRGPLHGVPIALKDNIHVDGMRTTCASKYYEDFVSEKDATVTEILKKAGAILIGKTNMHELSAGATGDLSYFGPAKNPHNIKKMTGGSSSGSASAVAANLAFASIGTDSGGSIRIPSAFCHIVGLKPTFGLISTYGIKPLTATLDHVGPMTKTVKDNALLLNIIVGNDKKDPYLVKTKKQDYTRYIGDSIKDMTIGIPDGFFFDLVQEDIKGSLDKTIESLMDMGVKTKKITINTIEDLAVAQQIIITAESYSMLQKELRDAPEKIDKEVRDFLVRGANIQASEYLHALKIKHKAIDELNSVFKKIDFLLTPTTPVYPPKIGQRLLDINGEEYPTHMLTRLTGVMNTTGFPSISIPGNTINDSPLGIQLIGKPLSEAKIYQLAHVIEKISY